MIVALAVVARLVAPTTSSTITVSDVDTSARSALEWFSGVRVLPRDETRRGFDDLRSCGTDDRCIAARLEQEAIDRALYVVASLETGFVSVELFARGRVGAIATEVAPIEGSVERAVGAAVAGAMRSAGHRRGARLVVDVEPREATARLGTIAIAPGDSTVVEAGLSAIDVSASGFVSERREVELTEGRETVVRVELEAEESIVESWWLWTVVGIVAASAIVVPIVATRSSGGPQPFCYGQACER
jgi:hypothetical protein